MIFNHISDTKPFENKDNLFYIIIPGVFCAVLIVILENQIGRFSGFLYPIVVLLFFLLRRTRRLLPDWVKEKDKIGELAFFPTNVLITNQNISIEYKSIKEIYFRFNYYRGKQPIALNFINNGLAELTITLKTKENYFLKFVIESESQLDFLKEKFISWYSLGIEIKEELTHLKIKTICLEKTDNLSYEELQKLKSKLKIGK